MKRDMDLVRELLLKIEEEGSPALHTVPEMAGRSHGEVAHLVKLLIQAGFLDAIDVTSMDGVNFLEIEMTWIGHDFLDQIRDPEIWQQTKAGATKVGSWSLKLLGEMAAGYARAKAAELGLPLG